MDFIVKDKNNLVYLKDGRKTYFEDVHLSDDLIYLVNANRITGLNQTQPEKSEILIFDFKGRPIKKYFLDRTIMRTAMDFAQNRLYGYDIVGMTYVYFDLGKI